ncbi:beta-class carbonic anhydrase [Alteribacillus bidgolensis]|uniref:carbonic anhydrase n=1 Tax=Alteribacillus bidgolensis TaxID=930129 RepID=A0A1G8EPG8_9BACI|nr:carbonic anhydrase [Alteribacillus bidgolensis]SDH71770.1 carbonic anhydrase [Alteribacillus bidgolensis]
MSVLDSILEFNENFVEKKDYEQYQTSKFPDKKLVILTCMDTRLLEMLPRALNLSNGDAKIIKNAGAMISHPFGSIMRSIIVALYELQAEEVAVIGHYGCGMTGLESNSILDKAEDRGIDLAKIEAASYAGVDVDKWLHGFNDVEDSVKNSVDIIRRHPLLPANTPVHGLAISPDTGKLTVLDRAE